MALILWLMPFYFEHKATQSFSKEKSDRKCVVITQIFAFV
jgi:hypothetical protein